MDTISLKIKHLDLFILVHSRVQVKIPISQNLVKHSCSKIKVPKEKSFHVLFSCKMLFSYFCLPVLKKKCLAFPLLPLMICFEVHQCTLTSRLQTHALCQ